MAFASVCFWLLFAVPTVAIPSPAGDSVGVWKDLGYRSEARQMNLDSLNLLARALLESDLVRSADISLMAIAAAEEAGDENRLANAKYNLGAAYLLQGQKSEALRNLKEAEALFAKLQDGESRAAALSGIGRIYQQTGDLAEAASYYNSAMQIFKELGRESGQGYALLRIGELQTANGEYVTAISTLAQAMRIAKKIQDDRLLSETMGADGLAHSAAGDYDGALKIFFAKIEIDKASGDLSGLCEVFAYLGETYIKMADFDEGLGFLRKSLETARQLKSLERESEALLRLSDAYDYKGDYKRALFYLRRHEKVSDSLFSQEKARFLEEQKYALKIGQREKDIALQREKIRRQQIGNYALAAVMLLLLAIGILLVRQVRYRRKINRKLKAEKENLARTNKEISSENQTLSALNQEKDKIFSIISHDLRSPLTSLHGLLLVLKSGVLAKADIEQTLQKVEERTGTSLQLLDDLLMWSSAHLRGIDLRPEKVELASVVEETFALIGGSAEQKGIRLRNQVKMGACVYADLQTVKLILRNLVTNAVKFTLEGGSITVRSEASDQKDFIKVSVIDTGIGMEEETRKKLFDPDRPSRTTPGTANEKGSGIGLLLSKEFVEKNGGQISVASEPGKGSTFAFTLKESKANKKKPLTLASFG